MNSLMNVGGVQTMSSREIAELTGKEHKHIIRDIRTIIAQLKDGPNLDHEEFQSLTDNRGYTSEYLLTKNQTLLLMTGYNIPLRQKLINRWQELENASKQQLPDFTNPAEAARAWAAEYEQKLIAQEKLSVAAPKADVYDRIVERNGLYNATQIAQKFGQSAIWLNKQLASMDVYNRSVKRGRVFQQWFIDKGYGIMRETENGFSQPMFYAEGEMWIVRKLSEEGLI
ncbi:DNA-binding protein [Klebsiella phage vB_KpnM_FZ14]|uniref:DNA-binding protein n=1 Tax=Klebsiella phage vB_KpnM_FZ14 TaxID=2530028 RepID=A0A4D6T4Y6_9CAUD|nr:anti-repressor Ant [Klebsiella phage vB_KpnM_FZ14]QCG76483.1 DNA-binding protein [Klebsiella phage vB_KpnM_FZ14]